jgi:uncharacterized protein (TIGR03435 family)
VRRLILSMALAVSVLGADPFPKAPAPPLSLDRLLQAPSGQSASWTALKGQAVVIEFWATWCTGCREQIAHLNALQKQFSGRPLRFISITDEDPALVARFLKDFPISGWIGIDKDGKTVKDYGIVGWPTTVLVDAGGVVQGVGNASALTAPILEALLAGQPVDFNRSNAAPAELQSAPNPLFQLMLRPAAPASATGYSPGAQSGVPGKRWEAWGVPIQTLLSEAYGVPSERIEFAAAIAWDKQARYDVAVAATALTDDRRRELLRQILQASFQTAATIVPRDTEVFVLESAPGEPQRLKASSSSSSRWGQPGNFTGIAVSMGGLANLASQNLRKPVLDETHLSGRFDFQLRWDLSDPNSIVQAVRTHLGLQLSPARRPLNHLVVNSLTLPAAW